MSQTQKHNLAKIAFILLASILLYGFIGCDVTKKQVKHYKKFIQYGGKINCKTDTLWKYDTTFVDGKMRIDSIPIPCNCPEVVIGLTNKQVRMFLKHQKDSMDYLLKLERIRSEKLQDSLKGLLKIEKEETKQVKEETKQVKSDNKGENIDALSQLLWVLVAVLILIGIIIYLIKRK